MDYARYMTYLVSSLLKDWWYVEFAVGVSVGQSRSEAGVKPTSISRKWSCALYLVRCCKKKLSNKTLFCDCDDVMGISHASKPCGSDTDIIQKKPVFFFIWIIALFAIVDASRST